MGELAGNRSQYVEVWRQILCGWLGWSSDRFGAWVARFDADLNDEGNPLFYHEDELYYVLAQLVPRELSDRLIWQRTGERYNDLAELKWQLGEAITNYPIRPSWGRPEFDWAAARQRVEAVLERWGAKLPGTSRA